MAATTRCRRHIWTHLFTDTDKFGVANDPRVSEPTPRRYTFAQWHGEDYDDILGYFGMYTRNQYRVCAECDTIGLHFPVSGRTVRADNCMHIDTAEAAREAAVHWRNMVSAETTAASMQAVTASTEGEGTQ